MFINQPLRSKMESKINLQYMGKRIVIFFCLSTFLQNTLALVFLCRRHYVPDYCCFSVTQSLVLNTVDLRWTKIILLPGLTRSKP